MSSAERQLGERIRALDRKVLTVKNLAARLGASVDALPEKDAAFEAEVDEILGVDDDDMFGDDSAPQRELSEDEATAKSALLTEARHWFALRKESGERALVDVDGALEELQNARDTCGVAVRTDGSDQAVADAMAAAKLGVTAALVRADALLLQQQRSLSAASDDFALSVLVPRLGPWEYEPRFFDDHDNFMDSLWMQREDARQERLARRRAAIVKELLRLASDAREARRASGVEGGRAKRASRGRKRASRSRPVREARPPAVAGAKRQQSKSLKSPGKKRALHQGLLGPRGRGRA